MRKGLLALLAALALAFGGVALAESYHIASDNAMNFGNLLVTLMNAYEAPAPDDADTLAADLEAIGSIRPEDGELARAIADHWMRVYVNADGSYRLILHDGGSRATALAQSGIPDSSGHAFVVLGFELENGEMTDELKGRCDAAAAAARAFPSAMLVCSGGATGTNNPHRHTEAGLMRDYLTGPCGIDPRRFLIDEAAMSTVENAVNTFALLRANDIHTITVVTSAYHQRWGQALYNAMAAMTRLSEGYEVEIVGNYSYDAPVREAFLHDDRWAARQLAGMLGLSNDVINAMKRNFRGPS